MDISRQISGKTIQDKNKHHHEVWERKHYQHTISVLKGKTIFEFTVHPALNLQTTLQTQILDAFRSCIDLTFTSQPSSVMDTSAPACDS